MARTPQERVFSDQQGSRPRCTFRGRRGSTEDTASQLIHPGQSWVPVSCTIVDSRATLMLIWTQGAGSPLFAAECSRHLFSLDTVANRCLLAQGCSITSEAVSAPPGRRSWRRRCLTGVSVARSLVAPTPDFSVRLCSRAEVHVRTGIKYHNF